jgi:hypothetical protein
MVIQHLLVVVVAVAAQPLVSLMMAVTAVQAVAAGQ